MNYRPWYNDRVDYQTNAKSYMEYLGRVNKFMKVLMEDYEVFQELVIEDLKRIKFTAEMEVEDILLNWLEDGTLYRIISEEVFKNKADKDWVDEQLNQLREDIQDDLNETTDQVKKDLKETTDEVDRKLQEATGNLDKMEKDIEDIYGRISNMVSISLYDVDPTGQRDSLQGFKDALNDLQDNEELLLHGGGTYLLSDSLELITDKTIAINGNGSTLKFDLKGGKKDGLSIKGIYKGTKNLTRVLEAGNNTMTLNNTSGVQRDDLIFVKSPEQFNSTRDYYKKGGTFTINEVINSQSLSFTGVFPYDISSAVVDIYSPVTLLLKNISIENKNVLPDGRYGIHMEFGVNSVFNNVKTDNFKNNIILRNLFNSHLTHVITGRSYYEGSNESYGLAIYACTHTNITNSTFASGRHGLEISGFENSFKTFIYNTHASSESGSVSPYGFNMHQSAYDVLAVNSTFKGFGMSNHTTFLNCNLFGKGSMRISENGYHTNFTIKDSHFHGNVDITTGADSMGNPHSARHLGKIDIENNTVTDSHHVRLVLGISNVVINYRTVLLKNTSQLVVAFDGKPKVTNLIFENGTFTYNGSMISTLDGGAEVDYLTLRNMFLGSRYDLIKFDGLLKKLIIDNVQVVSAGYEGGQMTIRSIRNDVPYGEMIVLNSDLSLLQLIARGTANLKMINSQMPISGATTYITSKQRAVFEDY